MPLFVLDSFALLAFFRNEVAAVFVRDLLERAAQGSVRLAMSVVNLGEVVYRTIREYGLERAQEVLGRINEYRIDIVEIDRELALAAAYLKGLHRVSYADCFAAALAQRLGAAVVTGDPDFRQLNEVVAIEWLPEAQ